MEIVKPTATFHSDLGEPLAASEVTMTAGFGVYPRVSLSLHAVEDVASYVNYSTVIKKLEELSFQSDKVVMGSVVLSQNSPTGLSQELEVKGIITSPGYATAYGAEPSYSIDLVHEVSTVSSFNSSLYKLTPSVLAQENSIKAIAVPASVYQAKTMGEVTLSIFNALIESYKSTGSDLSLKVKKSIHKQNETVLEKIKTIIAKMDKAGGPQWKSMLRGNTHYNLILQIYTALTNRGGDYTSNITALFYMFGMAWYSTFSEDVEEVIQALSYAELEKGNGKNTSLMYAPAALNYVTPRYPTSTGLAPTHTVVETVARPTVLQKAYSPTNIVACFPEPPSGGDPVLFHKTNAPLWLPDGASVTPIKYTPNGTMTPDSIEPIVDKTSKATLKTLTTLQNICQQWAEGVHKEKTLVPKTAELTIPMDLEIQPGAICDASSSDGTSFSGLVWNVTHKLVVNERAVTQIIFRPIIFNK